MSLITDPLDTVAGVPKGLAQLFQDIATTLSSATNPSEEGTVAMLLTMSSAKRLIGRDLDVDVYTSNAVLQKELNRLAWSVALGNLSVSIALIPVGGTVAQVVSLDPHKTALAGKICVGPWLVVITPSKRLTE